MFHFWSEETQQRFVAIHISNAGGICSCMKALFPKRLALLGLQRKHPLLRFSMAAASKRNRPFSKLTRIETASGGREPLSR
jgi:hypothetical protein